VVDPQGDGTVELVGAKTSDAHLLLSVPSGTQHDAWSTNTTLRVMQPAADEDFEIEAKFESEPTEKSQGQGLLVEQDESNYIRFDVYSNGSTFRVFAAQISNGSPLPKVNEAIASAATTYLRLGRAGDQWTAQYSYDGSNWVTAKTFSHRLAVSSVGVFASNNNPNPAYTAVVDYFFNTGSPVIPEDTTTLFWGIRNVQAAAEETVATITWTTNEPTTSDVAYGPTQAYENGRVYDSTYVTNHSIVLPNLDPATLYHYAVTSVDSAAESMSSIDLTFTTADPPGIESDDFNSDTLDTSLWTFIDPLGDGTVTMGSGTVNISVPSGTDHEVWHDILAPHIVQAVSDEDFEIEVKMESSLDLRYQEQGIVIKQDDGNHMRFEFYGDESSTNILAASFQSHSPWIRLDSTIDSIGVAPLYMRVRREGDLWTQTYSTDGTTWLDGASFTHQIEVSGVGLYAGNYAGDGGAPAHTASFDYFYDPALLP
jgi:regulation of enolase protein 1 (concanavalin A-like superfamily)